MQNRYTRLRTTCLRFKPMVSVMSKPQMKFHQMFNLLATREQFTPKPFTIYPQKWNTNKKKKQNEPSSHVNVFLKCYQILRFDWCGAESEQVPPDHPLFSTSAGKGTSTIDRFAVTVLPRLIVGRYCVFDKLLDGYPEGLTVRVIGISRMIVASQPVKRRDNTAKLMIFWLERICLANASV